ncbi:hypothetical protein O6H91_07G126800 [Diphasiastrum complanatum]|uniref:Uncharacterized protein n=1 Tax=Diphasiastrum complanatum TaxID=34168 RepID=A0ACC2D9E2_DIPCM|nr:hypothetical protein O6H91_07G126800 [Diphasiastrum complanatum]
MIRNPVAYRCQASGNLQKMALVMKVNHVPLKTCDGESKAALRDHRLALENDVAQLRKTLMLEVNMNKALKRAFYRPAGDLPRLPSYLPLETRELIAEVAVVEEEVVHLEDYMLFLQQDLRSESQLIAELEKQKQQPAYNQSNVSKKSCNQSTENGRQQFHSSKISKDVVVARLLSSLKEEPKNDLQRGPQLARHSEVREKFTIYEKQVVKQSRANSPCSVPKQKPSETSPRLYASSSPDIFSPIARSRDASPTGKVSAFKEAQRGKENYLKTSKFSDRWPQASKVKSAVHHNSSKNGPPSKEAPVAKMDLNKIVSGAKPQRSLSFQLAAVSQKTEANKLSEEMMRCLLSIYYIMTRPYPLSESGTSSTVSRSTFSSFNSQSYSSSICISMKTATEMSYELNQPDPYFECGERLSDIGPYKSFQSIRANSFDYSRIADSASMLRRLKDMVETLERIDLNGMSHQQKLAFWINIYNICMMHGFLEYGIPGSPHQVKDLMHKAVLNVGGYLVNALAIEHFILRSPCHSTHAFADILCKEKDSLQSGLGLESPEPKACFALCCGSYSSPAVRVYTPPEIEGELEMAKKEYLQAAVGITTRHKVAIPKLLDWNSHDFAKETESLLTWICQQIPVSLQKAVQECTNRANGIVSRALEVMPYDFRFRYLLA